MKTLYVIRHAKSSWAVSGQADFDRPLNDRGIANAPMMAKRLYAQNPKIDFVLCSPARRTTATAEAFASVYGWEQESIFFEKKIYEAPLSNLVEAISAIPNENESAVLFGHNNGVSLLVSYLSDEFLAMPTCAVATIALQIEDWQHISQGIGKLLNYDYPKNEAHL